jgi:disulfide bond formation protein DsbB
VSTAYFSRVFALLTVTANAAVLAALVLALASRRSGAARDLLGRVRGSLGGSALGLAWVVALVATLGSLYYSEIAHFTPCKLCWYQRIAMYPLVVVLGIAAVKRDAGVARYVVPVAGIGGLISAYHYTLQRFPGLSSGACDAAAPCTVTWVWVLNYISIPFMAGSALALIATLLLLGRPAPGPAPDDRTRHDERNHDEHDHREEATAPV